MTGRIWHTHGEQAEAQSGKKKKIKEPILSFTYFKVSYLQSAAEGGNAVPEMPVARSEDVLGPVLARLPSAVAGLLGRSSRATQAARDLAMLVSTVVGPRRPVAQVHRGALDHTALPGERRLRVLSVRQETPDALSIVIERPAGLVYQAGQFLTLVLPLDGGEVRRSYSLSSSPLDGGPLVITVKQVEGGLASRWLHRNVRPGAVLRVRGPSGNFTFAPADPIRRLVLVGGGSGITPLMGILRTALVSCPELPVHLLFANRSATDVIFRAELDQLAAAHPRLTVRHVLEAGGDGVGCGQGRVTAADLEAALGGEVAGSRVYLCGPEGMMSAAEAGLASLGLAPHQLKTERFVTVRRPVGEASGRLYQLRVGAKRVEVSGARTLLESATEARIDLDFSCTMGGCSACKARLVEGEVVMDEPNCLSEDERAAGLILTCVARPVSDVVIERLQ
jgi:ferredoxin-NADP reductase